MLLASVRTASVFSSLPLPVLLFVKILQGTKKHLISQNLSEHLYLIPAYSTAPVGERGSEMTVSSKAF